MSTLLLRLAAPLQAWGADSKFERRMSMREPTKSGVVGLLAAALGRRRDESVADLAALRFGVRIDQPGEMVKDYHIALADKPYVTERFYLADAVFLVGLEGEASFLTELETAVQSPVFPLFLGRRSCPPEGRITLGIYEKPLEQCLNEIPCKASAWYRRRKDKRKEACGKTVVIDSSGAGSIRRRDVPVSFSSEHRKHSFRGVEDNPYDVYIPSKEHDAYGEASKQEVE